MKLLGVDLETTSVDTETCFITEIGMVLYDTDENQSLFQFGGLVKLPEGEVIPDEAVRATSITTQMVLEHGLDWDIWQNQFLFLRRDAEGVVAHNHVFDKAILERYAHGPLLKSDITGDFWVDTMTDVPYPDRIKTRRLDYLCFEHGFMNPYPHRALTDVLSMFKILSMYPLEKVIELAESPLVWLRAEVSYDERNKAKFRNYWWDGTNRWWVKRIKRIRIEEETQGAEFPVEVLQGYEFKQTYT